MASKSAFGTRRRWLRWIIRIAVVVGIIISITAGLIWFHRDRIAAEGRKKLAATIAETDALDPRWRWEEIQEDLPAIPDNQNSIRIVSQVADSLQGWDPYTLTIPIGEYQEDVLNGYPANRVLDDQRLALIRKGLQNREPSLAIVASLKDFPRGRATIQLAPDFVSTRFQHALDCRAAIRLLELDIENLLDRTQIYGTVDRIQAILHAGAGLRDDPSLISQLVRMRGRVVAVHRTERLLGMAEVRDSDLRQLSADFKPERDERPFLVGIRGERASLNVLFENLEFGRVSLADVIASAGYMRTSKPDFSIHFAAFRYHPRLYEDHAFMLATMNEAFLIAGLPLPDQPQAWKDWDHRTRTAAAIPTVEKRLLVSFLFLSALSKVGVNALQDHARLSCVLAALSAERFRIAQKRWPKDLQELCPAYLDKVPIDPFDGKPLKFAHRGDGIVIYSVNKDGKDDGGDVHKKSPDDVDPKDLGLCLWNPDHRHLPPEPKKKEKPENNDK